MTPAFASPYPPHRQAVRGLLLVSALLLSLLSPSWSQAQDDTPACCALGEAKPLGHFGYVYFGTGFSDDGDIEALMARPFSSGLSDYNGLEWSLGIRDMANVGGDFFVGGNLSGSHIAAGEATKGDVQVRQLLAFLNTGYSVLNKNNWFVMPYLGAGGGFLNYRFGNTSTDQLRFDQTPNELIPAGRSRVYNLWGVAFEAGVSGQHVIPTCGNKAFLVGLEAGATYFAGRAWRDGHTNPVRGAAFHDQLMGYLRLTLGMGHLRGGKAGCGGGGGGCCE